MNGWRCFNIFDLLRQQCPSTGVSFGLTSDQAFGYQNEFTAVLAVPDNSHMMPLSIIDRRVLAEWQVNVLNIREKRHLHAVTMSLHHWSTIRGNVGRTGEKRLDKIENLQYNLKIYKLNSPNAVKRKEDSSFVLLRELHPHGHSETPLRSSEERNDLRSAATSWVAEVQIVVDLNSCETIIFLLTSKSKKKRFSYIFCNRPRSS